MYTEEREMSREEHLQAAIRHHTFEVHKYQVRADYIAKHGLKAFTAEYVRQQNVIESRHVSDPHNMAAWRDACHDCDLHDWFQRPMDAIDDWYREALPGFVWEEDEKAEAEAYKESEYQDSITKSYEEMLAPEIARFEASKPQVTDEFIDQAYIDEMQDDYDEYYGT